MHTDSHEQHNEESGLSHLPVIVGMGGVNAAGRTSGHQAFRRTVIDALPEAEQETLLLGLAALMGLGSYREGTWHDAAGNPVDAARLADTCRGQVLDHTLIRRIEIPCFNDEGLPANRRATLGLESGLTFTIRRRQLPERLAPTWQVRELDRHTLEVTVPPGDLEVLLPETRPAQVRAAGQLPSGFDPSRYYRSVHHPRGLSMAIFAASDCLADSGLEWDALRDRLDPDDIAVYAGNSIGQLDDEGWGGLLKSFVSGNRATSKQMPLGYGQMPADFLNAYVLGSVGGTGAALGACASFLYNLRLGVEDIRNGHRRAVMVGTSDAPVTPEIIEGFRAMGALADDESLKALDALELLTDADYQRACRPLHATAASPSPNPASSSCCSTTPWRWSSAPRSLAACPVSTSMPMAGSARSRPPASATTSPWARRPPWSATCSAIPPCASAPSSTPTAPAPRRTG
jgi:acetoacetyl-[acyl-carrier protein] synthase